MNEAVLLQVLDRLGNIEGTLHSLAEGQKRLEEEQLAIRKEQETIRKEQEAIRKEQQTIRQEQQILLQGQKEQTYLKSGLKELNELMTALLHRQDETDAKLEALATDIHNIHGEITFLKQDLHKLEEKADSHYQKLNEQLDNIKLDVDFAVHKTTENERELYKMKSRLF
ncbi:hypothetical protein [Parageobacillus toebii]|uniref:Uncharacterized protein n=1 Tax=Parageobacillus toebii TaxID=153151 RepID=A0A150N6X1_9BACL|nr:hypothetical protein [Parageobacillus toebii]KYD32460.1 hypothetical protein B4110_0349 [Parageobacillus toebii]